MGTKLLLKFDNCGRRAYRNGYPLVGFPLPAFFMDLRWRQDHFPAVSKTIEIPTKPFRISSYRLYWDNKNKELVIKSQKGHYNNT